MKPLTLFDYVCLFAVAMLILFACTGCSNKPAARQPINAKPLISAQEGKDRSVVEWSVKIDALVDQWLSQFPSPIGAEIKLATAGQREEVAKAPASQFNVILEAYKANAKTDADEIAKLTAQLETASARTDQVIRLGLAGFGALLIAGAVIIAVMAAKAGGIFVGVGPMQAGAIGAAGCVMLFASFAYGWATRNQSLVMGIFAALLVGAAFLWISNRRHASTA